MRKFKSNNIVNSFSYNEEFRPTIQELKVIAAREGKSSSELITEIISDYVKKHGSGNPSFELTKWVEEPEFKSDPALRENNDKWDRYLSQCDEKDLAQLQGVFLKRSEQAKHAWLKKKGIRK